MTISRAQMPRQLYEAGSLPADVEEIIQNIMEMTGISREEAIRIIQTMENPKETMDDATMIQEGYELEPRQQYGLGSIVKSVTKAVKGVAKGVGDVVSSDAGKLALLAAGTFGIPGTSFGGFSFLNPAKQFIGGLSPFAIPGTGPSAIGGNFYTSGAKLGSFLGSKKGIASAIGGASLLAGAFASPQEAQELFTSDRSAFTGRLRQYAKNLNPDATDEQIDALVAANTPTDVSSFEKLYRTKLGREVTGDTFADGGRAGYEDGGDVSDTDVSNINVRGIARAAKSIVTNPMAQAIASYALGGLPALAQYGKGQAVGTVTGNQLANIINHKAMMDTYASKGFGIGMTNPTARAAHAIAANSSGYGDINSISGLGYGIEDDPSDFGGGYSDGTSSASDGGEAGADAASSAGANDGPDTGGSFAQGGIPSIPMGELRENAQGVQELDYRQDGGFVPVGIKEKADDVPAMLSKNEFVMTADAVRGMGNGNIENGAQKMYNLMKSLENRMA